MSKNSLDMMPRVFLHIPQLLPVYTVWCRHVLQGLISCCLLPFHFGAALEIAAPLSPALILPFLLLPTDTVPCYQMRKPRPERSGRKNGTNLWLTSLIAFQESCREDEAHLRRHFGKLEWGRLIAERKTASSMWPEQMNGHQSLTWKSTKPGLMGLKLRRSCTILWNSWIGD